MADDRVDEWFDQVERWRDELTLLRSHLSLLPLEETFKWRQPCYTHEGRNILILSLFKRAAVVSFFKGSLLQDPTNELESPGENSRHGRYLSYTSISEIEEKRELLEGFVLQAIEISRAGTKVDPPSHDLDYCEELREKLSEDEAFKIAFESLTPGRRRAYHLHFSGAKQAKTRRDRIEKYATRILDGKGIHDCICGQSKRMPRCDGSHSRTSKTVQK